MLADMGCIRELMVGTRSTASHVSPQSGTRWNASLPSSEDPEVVLDLLGGLALS